MLKVRNYGRYHTVGGNSDLGRRRVFCPNLSSKFCKNTQITQIYATDISPGNTWWNGLGFYGKAEETPVSVVIPHFEF